MGADQRQIERYIPDDKIPVRQYFHSRTNQPIVGGDWDIDSDDDSTDDRWLEKVTTSVSFKARLTSSIAFLVVSYGVPLCYGF
jgi:hypothetical protein